MGREENNFHIDPFINYVNPENGTSHKIKGRFYYSADNSVRPTEGSSITDILGNIFYKLFLNIHIYIVILFVVCISMLRYTLSPGGA